MTSSRLLVDFVTLVGFVQPSPSRSEASARKNMDWDLGVTSPLKVLQNA